MKKRIVLFMIYNVNPGIPTKYLIFDIIKQQIIEEFEKKFYHKNVINHLECI